MFRLPEGTNLCSHRHSFFLDNFFRRLIQPPRKIVAPYIKKGDFVVDLGCGPGFFTLAMAELVGDSGTVLAVDVQPEMLDILAGKLCESQWARRVRLHRCAENTLGLDSALDAQFILAYYMVHEVPDQKKFLSEVKQILHREGVFLIVEPPFHVSRAAFQQSLEWALGSGFKLVEQPRRKGGMSALLIHS